VNDGRKRQIPILLRSVTEYVPLCGDPEKTPYPAAVSPLCLSVCRDVYSK